MSFSGGPVPIYPSRRPLTEVQLADPTFKPLPAEEDKEWLDLVKYGAAGDIAETKEQQKRRYEAKKEDSAEVFPALAKHIFRVPDLLCSCGFDYTIRTWDLSKVSTRKFEQKQMFEGHFNFVNAVVPYHGSMIVSASDDCSVRLWKLGDEPLGELLMTYYICASPLKCVCVVPGERFCVGSLDRVFRVCSFVNGRVLLRLEDHELYGPDDNYFQKEGCGAVTCCLHLRQNLVFTGSDDSTLRLWDIDTGKSLHVEKGHPGYGRDIGECGIGYKLAETFAGVHKIINLGDDGNHICTCCYDRTIAIWNVADPNNVQKGNLWRVGDNGVIHVAAVGPSELATSCGDKEMRIWNWKTKELLHQVRTERGVPTVVCYVNKYMLAMCGGDATIRILDWEHEECEDRVGKKNFGVYAHEYIITDCVGIHLADDDSDHFVEPIMYCNIAKEKGEADAKEGIDQHKLVLNDAIEYLDLSLWDSVYGKL